MPHQQPLISKASQTRSEQLYCSITFTTHSFISFLGVCLSTERFRFISNVIFAVFHDEDLLVHFVPRVLGCQTFCQTSGTNAIALRLTPTHWTMFINKRPNARYLFDAEVVYQV